MEPISVVEKNPDATMPLIIGAYVTCNTKKERVLENMRTNAEKQPHGWIKRDTAHDGTAIICGGGSSIEDHISQIAAAQAAGGMVFALNGCSSFLRRHGITADYQVIMDAQPETADLVDLDARMHLFASQVDPKLFEMIPDAVLWHATYGEVAPEFPQYQDDYTMIGGSYTVGNACLVLAFCMGYRKLDCYGFDSSHRERKSHAYPQSMNDGDTCTLVTFGGKEYLCSLTMKLQAMHFIERAKSLKAEGCDIKVYGDGLLPAMYNAPPMPEVEKYSAMWKLPQYRMHSPGEETAFDFVRIAKPQRGQTVADLGCGTGRGGRAVKRLCGCDVVYVDFVEHCKDEGRPDHVCDLADTPKDLADFAYCTDVLEHIPPERLVDTINGIMGSAPNVFFQISTVQDSCGDLICQTLHMNVCPSEVWLEFMQQIQTHKVRYYEDRGDSCLFYLTKG